MASADRAAGSAATRGGLDGGRPSAAPRWLPTPRRNPFALGSLAVLLAGTVFARTADPALVHRWQAISSTDVHHLLHDPLLTLLLSALWVMGPVWLPYFWAFGLIMVPLERRIGSLRTAGVFAAGHVVATLASEGVVAVAVATGRLGSGALDVLDIGISYGVLAGLGALGGLLPPRRRVPVLLGAAGVVAYQVVADHDLVTGVGHPVALLVGVALSGLLSRRPERLRNRSIG